MTKNKANALPSTIIAFEFAGRTSINEAGERVEHVTVTARRGTVGFVADVEMRSLEADLLPVLKRVQSVFFKAETEGLPEFPNLDKALAAPAETQASATEEQTFQVKLFGMQNTDAEPTGEEGEEIEPDQVIAVENTELEGQSDEQISPDHDYYAELADQYENPSTEEAAASPDQFSMF